MSTKTAQPGDFVMSIHAGLVCTLEHPVISLVRRLDICLHLGNKYGNRKQAIYIVISDNDT